MAPLASTPVAQGAMAGAAVAGGFRAAVMQAVDRIGCDCTTQEVARLVGRQPGRDSNRRHSAAVMQELCALAAIGYLRRVGDLPVVWVRVVHAVDSLASR